MKTREEYAALAEQSLDWAGESMSTPSSTTHAAIGQAYATLALAAEPAVEDVPFCRSGRGSECIL